MTHATLAPGRRALNRRCPRPHPAALGTRTEATSRSTPKARPTRPLKRPNRSPTTRLREQGTGEDLRQRRTSSRTPLVRETSELYASQAEQMGITFLIDAPSVPTIVTANEAQLRRTLCNLLDNAIKFSRPQGEVVVSAKVEDEQTIIRVRDTGVGIPPEHLPRVFERFYRVDKARSRELGGTGLGLAIVKHLTRAHGGDAEVNSTVGQGCEFVIKLPKRDSLES